MPSLPRPWNWSADSPNRLSRPAPSILPFPHGRYRPHSSFLSPNIVPSIPPQANACYVNLHNTTMIQFCMQPPGKNRWSYTFHTVQFTHFLPLLFHQLLQNSQQLIHRLIPSFPDVPGHTGTDMIAEQFFIKCVQRRVDCRHLYQNIRAVCIPL